MRRTSANVTGGREKALLEEIVEAPIRGRGRARARDRAHGTALARGRGHEGALVRGRSSEEQVPLEPATTPLLQDSLLRVSSVLESFPRVVM